MFAKISLTIVRLFFKETKREKIFAQCTSIGPNFTTFTFIFPFTQTVDMAVQMSSQIDTAEPRDDCEQATHTLLI